MNEMTLIFSTFFGAIGVGYFIYGRRQQKAMPLLVGVALSIFPFFISSIILTIIIGVVLILLPWFVEL